MRKKGLPEVGYQSCRYNGLFLEDELAVCRDDGIKVFDIFFDGFLPSHIDAGARRRIREKAGRFGIRLLVDAPLLPFGGPHSKVFRDCVDFAEDVGSSLLTVHIGHLAAASDPEGELRRCAKRGITVGLENAERGSGWDRPDSLEKLAARCPKAANLGFTLDIGHANLVGRAAKVVPRFLGACESLGLPLVCIHAHDNAGDADSHLGLGRGNVDFKAVFSQVRDTGFAGPIVIEHWRDLEKDRKFLKKLI